MLHLTHCQCFLTLFRPIHTFVKCNWCVTYPIIAQDIKLLYEIRDVDILQNQGDAFKSGPDEAERRALMQVHWAAQSGSGKSHAEGKGTNQIQKEAPQLSLRRKSSWLS